MQIVFEKIGNSGASLTAYLHDKSQELRTAAVRPAMLIFPGGGYFNCSDREAEPIALAYAAEGYNSFVLRYTVGASATFSEAFEDAQAAIALLRQRADTWAVDADRIAVIGFSAGGHLAAMLGCSGTIRPNALILCYPCILDDMGKGLGKELPSADKYVDSDTPPTFLFSTRDDRIVPIRNSLAFASALDKAGVPFELHIFRHGEHGLSLAKPLTANGVRGMNEPSVAGWFDMSVNWLKGQWGDFPADSDTPPYDVAAEGLHLDTPIEYLLANPQASNILQNYAPDLASMAKQNEETRKVSLNIIRVFAPDVLSEEVLRNIENDLKKCNLSD